MCCREVPKQNLKWEKTAGYQVEIVTKWRVQMCSSVKLTIPALELPESGFDCRRQGRTCGSLRRRRVQVFQYSVSVWGCHHTALHRPQFTLFLNAHQLSAHLNSGAFWTRCNPDYHRNWLHRPDAGRMRQNSVHGDIADKIVPTYIPKRQPAATQFPTWPITYTSERDRFWDANLD